MTKAYRIQEGDRVEGEYCGYRVSGIVESSRFHTCRSDLIEISVKLDAPISIFGDMRDRVTISCDAETGGEVRGWSGQVFSYQRQMSQEAILD